MTSPLKARKPTLKRRPPTFSAPAPTFWPRSFVGFDAVARGGRWVGFSKVNSFQNLQILQERWKTLSRSCSLQYFALILATDPVDVRTRTYQGCQWSVGHLHNHWPPPGVSGPTVAKCGDTISANKKTQKAFSQLYTVSQPLRAKRGQKLLDSKSEASTTDHHVRSPDHAGFLNVSSFIRLSF